MQIVTRCSNSQAHRGRVPSFVRKDSVGAGRCKASVAKGEVVLMLSSVTLLGPSSFNAGHKQMLGQMTSIDNVSSEVFLQTVTEENLGYDIVVSYLYSHLTLSSSS